MQVVGRTADGKLYLATTGDTDPDKLDAVEDLNEERGADVPIEHVELKNPLEAYAQNDVVGGAGYQISLPGGNGSCSLGFSAWDPEGNPALLTAGHCAEVEGTVTTNPTRTTPSQEPAVTGGSEAAPPLDAAPIGTWGFNQYGGPGNTPGAQNDPNSTDIAVIDVTNTSLNLLPEVTDWESAASDDLSASTTDITAVGDPQQGEPISRSGRTTGLQSDENVDLAEGWAQVSGRWVHGFAVDGLEAAPGDSGGAMFQGETAVGLVSGGGEFADGTPYVWGTRLVDALELTDGYTVALKIDAPTLTSPENGGNVAAGGDITGEAPAGTTLEITPQGGETQEVEVGDDGEWTIEAPTTPGTQAYTAVATEGFNTSEALDFSVNVTAAEPTETATPTPTPTDEPTETPTDDPTETPTDEPTESPSDDPTESPSEDPSDDPSVPADPTLSIDPERIEASDFVDEESGVEIVATGFDEGETVTLTISNGPEGVEGLELTETANAEGVVGFSIFGTNASNPEVYIGQYDVSVAGEDGEPQAASFAGAAEAFAANVNGDVQAAGTVDDPLTGSFEVVADGSGEGGGNDDGGNGGDLPRTGAELTGLAIGAGLLVAGGAALVLSRRKKA